MSTYISPPSTIWQQHLGNGDFVWVRSFTGTERVTADGHFTVTILENHRTDGYVDRRVLTGLQEEYTADMPDEWREDVVTPEIARERATLIIEACGEIARKEALETHCGAAGLPRSGGTYWNEAHLKARKEADEAAERRKAHPNTAGNLGLAARMTRHIADKKQTADPPLPPNKRVPASRESELRNRKRETTSKASASSRASTDKGGVS